MSDNKGLLGNFFGGDTAILFFIILFLLIFWGCKGSGCDNDC